MPVISPSKHFSINTKGDFLISVLFGEVVWLGLIIRLIITGLSFSGPFKTVNWCGNWFFGGTRVELVN